MLGMPIGSDALAGALNKPAPQKPVEKPPVKKAE
jgi:hypothetical protein